MTCKLGLPGARELTYQLIEAMEPTFCKYSNTAGRLKGAESLFDTNLVFNFQRRNITTIFNSQLVFDSSKLPLAGRLRWAIARE